MGRRRDDPIDERKLTLMRIANGAARYDFSLAGRSKEGSYARRKPSMPKMPWDDKPEGQSDGGS